MKLQDDTPIPVMPRTETCGHCGRQSTTTATRRRNTRYVDDTMNFVHTCLPCFIEEERYWEEGWAEYYRGCL